MSDAANTVVVTGAAPAPSPAAPAPAPGVEQTPEAKVLTDAEKAQAAAAEKAAAEIAAAKKPEAPAEVTYEYSPTGDAGLDLALEFVGKLGIPAEHTAMQQAITGDFTALKATMETLGPKAKGWERYLALAETSFASRTKAAAEKTAQDEAAVYKAVGGKEVWDKIAAYTKANADDGEKAHIQAALKAGGLQAQSMALLLQKAYERGNPSTPRVARQEAAPAASGTNGAEKLSLADYHAKVRAIRGKSRGPLDSNPEYLALRRQFANQ